MQTNAQQDRSSDPPERPARPPSAPGGAPPESSDGEDAAVRALYAQLFGEPAIDPPPDPMQAFCLVYELIRRRPELRGTVRAAVQSAENAHLTQEHEIAAGGGGSA
jgi:hypothetical protein